MGESRSTNRQSETVATASAARLKLLKTMC